MQAANIMFLQTRNKLKINAAFTLVELLVVIAIISTISFVGIVAFASYGKIQALNSASADVISVLQLAKSRAQSQVKPEDITLCEGFLDGYEVVLYNSSIEMYAYCDRERGSNPILTKILSRPIMFGSLPVSAFLFKVLTGGVDGIDGGGSLITINDTGASFEIRYGTMYKTVTVYPDGRIITD